MSELNNLIPISYDNPERPTVSGRELHEFLQVGADYRHWFPRMVEYGFTEGEDFNPVKIDRVQDEGGRKTAGKQHRLSVPANEWQTIGQNKRPPCKQRTRKAAKRERLTDHIPQLFYHTRQPTSSPAATGCFFSEGSVL